LAHLKARYAPDLVLAPQGLGGHVDHRVMIAAVLDTFPLERMLFYRDTPYAIRAPGAAPVDRLLGLPVRTIPIGGAVERKIAAAQAYASQIGFQFQGPANTAAALRDFAVQEGAGAPAERFSGNGLPPSSWPAHALRQP
jgi:LmbE family N-acetylglucosaminyl deacetylase